MSTSDARFAWGGVAAKILGGAIFACVLGLGAVADPAGENPVKKTAEAAAPTVVILVRHAEKAAEPGADPPLSDAGRARVDRLVKRFSDEGRFAGVVTSQLRRTKDTGAPIAARCGAETVVVEAGKDVDAHAGAVAGAIRERWEGKRSLYVGHSNTIVPVIRALGADPGELKIADDEYDRLFTVTIATDGKVTLAETKQ